MAHPKRKHSRSRTRKRRTHQRSKTPTLTVCSQCKNLKPPYRVCPFCGYYKGRKVLIIKDKAKKKKR
ncbi:MAG: 50S ribosomal protein L32 [Candidatus Omnitrophica bacterium]|nr:50S ribosomal protein L32 [Candidatus Omnitrophota bacterium]